MRIFYFIIFLVLFILLQNPLLEHAEARWKYRVTPMLKNNSVFFPREIANTSNFRSVFHGELNGVYSWEKWFKFILQPVVEYNSSAKRANSRLPNSVSNSEELFYDLREAYAQFRFRPFTLSLGNMIHTWGITDGYSPLDVVNTRRFVSPMNSDKLGAPTVQLNWSHESFIFDAIYIPEQRRSILPGEDSRWLPRTYYVNRAFEGFLLQLPNNLRYYYITHEDLTDSLKNNFGARLRGSIFGIDFSFVYFEGTSNSPATNLQLSGNIARSPTESQPGILNLDPDVGLKPVFYKRRVTGGTLVFTVGEFIFKTESAVTQQISTERNKGLPGDYHEHIFSLEHDFPVGDGKLTALAQVTYGKYLTSAENGASSLSRIFESAGIFSLRYAPNEQWSLLTSFLYDSKYKSTATALHSEYKLRDNLSAGIFATLLEGTGLSPLATYERNDFLAASLRYDF